MANDVRARIDEALSQVRVSEELRTRIAARATRPRRRAVSKGAALAVALIAALALFGAALASGDYLGSIDWWGRPQREDTWGPEPTPSDPEYEARMERQSALGERAHELLAAKPEGEYWVAAHEFGSALGIPGESFDDFEQMAQRIRESGLPLLLPSFVPEGYAFVGGRVDFFPTEAMVRDASPYAVERAGEIVLKKYRFDEALEHCIEGYCLDYVNGAGKRLIIDCRLDSSRTTSYGFGVWAGDLFEKVRVPGMKAALSLQREGGMDALFLYKTGLEPVVAGNFCDIGGEAPSASRLDSAVIDIRADDMSKEDLLTIARGLA